jgi:hypothetical protein
MCGVEETTVLWLTDNDDAAQLGRDVLSTPWQEV